MRRPQTSQVVVPLRQPDRLPGEPPGGVEVAPHILQGLSFPNTRSLWNT